MFTFSDYLVRNIMDERDRRAHERTRHLHHTGSRQLLVRNRPRLSSVLQD